MCAAPKKIGSQGCVVKKGLIITNFASEFQFTVSWRFYKEQDWGIESKVCVIKLIKFNWMCGCLNRVGD